MISSSPTYAEYCDELRRFDQTDFLYNVARRAASQAEFGFDERWKKGNPSPWALAGMARDIIRFGNKFRSTKVNDRDLAKLTYLFNESYEAAAEDLPLDVRMLGFFYEQFTYQTDPRSGLIRQYLIRSRDAGADKQIKLEDWTEVLGCSLLEALDCAFILYTASRINEGVLTTGLLTGPQFARFKKIVPEAAFFRTVDRLIATPAELKLADEGAPTVEAHANRFRFNPLTARPLVQVSDDTAVCPQPRLILEAHSLEGLYYAGIKHWGIAFANQLGNQFEDYVGHQLKHTDKLDVRGEITWGPKKLRSKSVDWIVQTDDAVLLIECKSARMTLGARAGGNQAAIEAYEKFVAKASEQIDITAAEIASGNPDFVGIAADRRTIGLIVTAEPFYAANLHEVRERLPERETPYLTISVSDLEILSELDSSLLARLLISIVDDPALYGSLFNNALQAVSADTQLPSNSIIDDALESYLLPNLHAAAHVDAD